MVVHLTKRRGGTKGQTSLEYLLLLAMVFITAYIIVRGPVATFTAGLFRNLFGGLQNMVSNAEWSPNQTSFDQNGDPSSQGRLKALHL